MVDQMVQRHASDGHAQVGAVCEVAGAQPSGVVDLGEEDLLGRSLEGTPLLDASLQGPQLAVGETSGAAALQVGEQSFGLQSRVDAELRFQLRPESSRRSNSGRLAFTPTRALNPAPGSRSASFAWARAKQ